ncbi:MAG TPA: hypothetical protein VKM55_26645 [Candidatus Lokiarchaeia archaeon]|nr:hypothetical protein [Candidatus Lokiarchaeia archaeon]
MNKRFFRGFIQPLVNLAIPTSILGIFDVVTNAHLLIEYGATMDSLEFMIDIQTVLLGISMLIYNIVCFIVALTIKLFCKLSPEDLVNEKLNNNCKITMIPSTRLTIVYSHEVSKSRFIPVVVTITSFTIFYLIMISSIKLALMSTGFMVTFICIISATIILLIVISFIDFDVKVVDVDISSQTMRVNLDNPKIHVHRSRTYHPSQILRVLIFQKKRGFLVKIHIKKGKGHVPMAIMMTKDEEQAKQVVRFISEFIANAQS